MTGAAPAPPGAEARYREQLARWTGERERLDRVFQRIGLARFLAFSAGVVLAILVVTAGVAPAWVLAPVLLFAALLVWHERVARGREAAGRSAQYYGRGLDRLAHRWMTGGDDGSRFHDDSHLYTTDLEIFGRGSLFQLLSTCRTETGSGRLAGWLSAPAPPDELRQRQVAVGELAQLSELRHDLSVIGPAQQTGLDSGQLRRWARAPAEAFPAWVRSGAPLLAALNLMALVGWALSWWPGAVAAGSLAVGMSVSGAVRLRVRRVLQAADAPERDLVLLAALLERVSAESFRAPWLSRLHARWHQSGADPASEVRRLARLVDLVDARRNQLFAPVAGAVLLGTQLAVAIERWRQRVGPAVVDWLEAVGDLEAAVALGTFAYEHPDDVFPEVAEGPRRLVARGLGHPLLDQPSLVRNDLRLEEPCRLIVVSGSNMSGKSTLLKAIGVNLVLAQAGAPVRADELETAPFAVGASLVLRDSLLEGRSRFYAEIVRLRDIVALTDGDRPVLFLLDELLSGTNSHDRAIGADGLLRGLVARGACGLVTTHDLALTRIADALGDRAANWHLEDRLIDGQLHFDYRLRRGVVARSNALELMRSVGLGVGGAEPGVGSSA